MNTEPYAKKDHSPAAARAFEAFHAAVGADAYRVTSRKQPSGEQEKALEAMKAGLRVGNASRQELAAFAARVAPVWHLGREAGGALPGFAPGAMPLARIADLAATMREHLYYTPMSKTLNLVLIDDTDPARITKMRAAGIEPCFVQRSSPQSWQALVKWPRRARIEDPHLESQARGIEYLARVKLAQALNKEFGDPGVTNCIQPMRAPGTPNCKPKHSFAGQFPIVEIVEASGAVARSLIERHAEIMRGIKAEQEQHAGAPGIVQFGTGDGDASAGAVKAGNHKAALLLEIYKAHASEVLRLSPQLTQDGSAVDLRVAQRMAAAGHDQDSIRTAVLLGAPGLKCQSGRKHVWADYAARTAAAINDQRSVSVIQDLKARYSKMFSSLEARAARGCDLSLPDL